MCMESVVAVVLIWLWVSIEAEGEGRRRASVLMTGGKTMWALAATLVNLPAHWRHDIAVCFDGWSSVRCARLYESVLKCLVFSSFAVRRIEHESGRD